MSNIDWDTAPEVAEFYADARFRKEGFFFDGTWLPTLSTRAKCKVYYDDYCERPQTQQSAPTIAQDATNKYIRQIVGLDGKTCQIDVYRVLAAFEVDSHPVAHAIKKLLAPGMRHAKTREQDLREAIASIEAELLLMEQSK